MAVNERRVDHVMRKALRREQRAARESRLEGVAGRRYVSLRQFSHEVHTPIKRFDETYPLPTLDAGRHPVGFVHTERGHIGWDWVVSAQHTWMPRPWFKRYVNAKADAKARRDERRAHEAEMCASVNVMVDNILHCPRALDELTRTGCVAAASRNVLFDHRLSDDFWRRVAFLVQRKRNRRRL